MRRAALALAAAALTCAGCADDVGDPLPQWLVFAGTDAPLPQFGDRLLIEVLGEDGEPACLGCRRQVGASDPEAWPASFGVVPPEGGGAARVRVRLYRADHTGPDGLPFGLPVIDALATLPPPGDGVVEVGLALSMSCLGVPSDVPGRMTCDPASGALAGEPTLAPAAGGGALPRPGTFPAAAEVPCPAQPPAGMICHPGGLFALGDPYFFPLNPVSDPLPERLVQLPPYALDADEVTVGQVRALLSAGQLTVAPVLRGPTGDLTEACTFLGPGDAANDALPVNCVSHALAEQACAAMGKRLPTEAEWEFAAVNRTRESRFPWGDQEAACAHSIVGYGRFVTEVQGNIEESSTCRARSTTALPWGPVAGGKAEDVTALGVRNLGGNVDEYVADWFQSYSEPCWSQGAGLLVGPRCDEPSPTPGLGQARTIRGGSWDGRIFRTRAVERNAGLDGGALVSTGFRCAASFY